MGQARAWLDAAGRWIVRVLWTRRAATIALVVVATVLAFGSAFAIWLKQVVLSTPVWTATTADMLENDEIRSAVAAYSVDELYARVDVAGEIAGVLPDQLAGLAGPASAGLRRLALTAANDLLESAAVQQLWEEANEQAHAQFLEALESDQTFGDDEPVVVLDLGPLVASLGERIGLAVEVASQLGVQGGEIVILRGDDLETTRRVAHALDVAAFWLGAAALVLYAFAVWLARGRRRETLRAVGVGLIAAALVLVVVRRLVGSQIVDAIVEAAAVKPAGLAAWWISTTVLATAAYSILALGVLTVVGAWLAGPGRRATAVRRWFAPTLVHRPLVVYSILVAAFLLALVAGPATVESQAVAVVILFALTALGVEAIRRQTAREFPDAEPGPGVVGWLRGLRKAEPAPAPEDRIARLERLAALRAQGMLTDAEVEAEKARILQAS